MSHWVSPCPICSANARHRQSTRSSLLRTLPRSRSTRLRATRSRRFASHPPYSDPRDTYTGAGLFLDSSTSTHRGFEAAGTRRAAFLLPFFYPPLERELCNAGAWTLSPLVVGRGRCGRTRAHACAGPALGVPSRLGNVHLGPQPARHPSTQHDSPFSSPPHPRKKSSMINATCAGCSSGSQCLPPPPHQRSTTSDADGERTRPPASLCAFLAPTGALPSAPSRSAAAP
mgnify:FL=1